jgi:polyhydroxyalkanoate synthesis regulator protein
MKRKFVITYYKNRKLYSNDASRYVNLTECKELIEAGYSVQFIAHKTGEDVTEQCLKEMICKIPVSQSTLLKLLKRGADETQQV